MGFINLTRTPQRDTNAPTNGTAKRTSQRTAEGTQTIKIIKKEQELTSSCEVDLPKQKVNNSESVDEAMQALQILGYNKKEIEKAFEKIANLDVSVEELIKKGLSILAR